MKQEFVLAFNELLEDKQLPREIILEALTEAIRSAYYKSTNTTKDQRVVPEINLEKGEMHIFVEKEVAEDVMDDRTEVSLEVARVYDPKAELGNLVMVEIESTPKDFGRVAAQNARQMLQQKIREAEYKAQIDFYKNQVGEIVSGTVQAVSPIGLSIGLELKAEGSIPRKEMIPHERFDLHSRIRALVLEVNELGKGPQIVLSRTHKDFLRRMLENEVPEIFHGIVEIRSIAREPGQRAKVAVTASQQGIDPVGACVGQRGVRIQAIVRELHNEKIDVIEYDSDPTSFIAKAIRPARVSGVYLNDSGEDGKTALVVVPEDQLSLAIGRDGQNARLAAKITNWRIDIKSLPEATADWLNALSKDPKLAKNAQVDKETIQKMEDILMRKSEGRVISPEEYDHMILFVDRLERKLINQRQASRKEKEDILEKIRKTIPAGAFDLPLANCELPKKIIENLGSGGYENAGQLAMDVKTNSEKILNLPGIGPKTLEKIQAFIEDLAEIVPKLLPPKEIEEKEAVVENVIVEEILSTDELQESEELLISSEAEIAAPPQESPVSQGEQPVSETTKEVDFDEMFKAESLKVTSPIDLEEEEEAEPVIKQKDKKKKKKRKFREVTYDPDLDLTIVRKKHKSGEGEDWEE